MRRRRRIPCQSRRNFAYRVRSTRAESVDAEQLSGSIADKPMRNETALRFLHVCALRQHRRSWHSRAQQCRRRMSHRHFGQVALKCDGRGDRQLSHFLRLTCRRVVGENWRFRSYTGTNNSQCGNKAVEPKTGRGLGGQTWPLVFSFLRHSFSARVSSEAEPTRGPVELRTLVPESRHVGQNWEAQPGGYQKPSTARFADFDGDRPTAFRCHCLESNKSPRNTQLVNMVWVL
jgi:hypothetical protein